MGINGGGGGDSKLIIGTPNVATGCVVVVKLESSSVVVSRGRVCELLSSDDLMTRLSVCVSVKPVPVKLEEETRIGGGRRGARLCNQKMTDSAPAVCSRIIVVILARRTLSSGPLTHVQTASECDIDHKCRVWTVKQ